MITCTGIRTNNLKNISVSFPENVITAITGISGSGKSSLAFDTLFSESQRVFLQLMFPQLSSLGIKLNKPPIDAYSPILPAVSMQQVHNNLNPRSTVGSFSDVSQILRTAFSQLVNLSGGKTVPSTFSPNSPLGACKRCNGLGVELVLQENQILDVSKSISEGCVKFWMQKTERNLYIAMLDEICIHHNISPEIPFKELPILQKSFLLHGLPKPELYTVKYRNKKKVLRTRKVRFQGILNELNDFQRRHSYSEIIGSIYGKYFVEQTCSVCKGRKLSNDSLSHTILGINYSELENLEFSDLIPWIERLVTIYPEIDWIQSITDWVLIKLRNFIKCGIEYLTLARSIPSLSGGEYQRLRLSLVISDRVSNMLFIFDEPSAGLHPKDVSNVFTIIREICISGNTILIVEHNPEIIKKCDYVIDVGPGAGKLGGSVLYMGYLSDFKGIANSPTCLYLESISKECKNIAGFEEHGFLNFIDIKENNVAIDVINIPLCAITAFCGVSGSGKSSLLNAIQGKILSHNYRVLENDLIDFSVVAVDQKSISNNQRSVVATYLGIYDAIRKEFSTVIVAGKKNEISSFSFNTIGGRCPDCKGLGTNKVAFDFLDDTFVECPTCHGKRFNDEVLSISYKGYSIYDVLELTIDEALLFFKENPFITSKLQAASDIGIGYIKLGQTSNTLSGGESQRLKLATEISKNKYGKHVMYFIDEPSSGLHPYDVDKVFNVLHRLVQQGSTVIIAEHTIPIIKQVDHIVELGPGSGKNGGKVIFSGRGDEIQFSEKSVLKKYIL